MRPTYFFLIIENSAIKLIFEKVCTISDVVVALI